MTDEKDDALFAVFISLTDQTWLLPNVAVADVLAFDSVEMTTAGPNWLLGFKHWQGQRLPVISPEALCGGDVPDRTQRARLLIVNLLGGAYEQARCVMVAQGYPQLTSINARAIRASDDERTGHPAILSAADVARNRALIPDLAYIDAQLAVVVPAVDAAEQAAAAQFQPAI